MSIEQKLRDNLEAAAEALIVPNPRRDAVTRSTRTWRHGLGFTLAGAAAVLVLAIPAFLLWSGAGGESEPGVRTTDSPAVVGSTGETRLPTPSSTLGTDTTTPTESLVTLAETIVGDYRLVLSAERVDDENPPTATVKLQSFTAGASRATDEIAVGTSAGFFWHTVTGADAVCAFTAEPGEDRAEVEVQILLGPSLGCSDTYTFEMVSGELSLSEQAPEDVARGFVSAWQSGDEELMAELADSGALRQAEGLSRPIDPVYSYCEGAAGSVYCTFEEVGGELVVRVRSERPARVLELIFVPDE